MKLLERAAVIGMGSISTRHRSNLKTLFPSVKVYSMSSSGRSDCETPSFADFVVDSIEELLALNLDLVVVASPAPFHIQHASPFVRSGVPTFIEKPIVDQVNRDTLKHIQELESSQLGVGYCLRYMPAIDVVKEALANESLGEIYNVCVEVGQYLPDWRTDKHYKDCVSASEKLGGGALLELSHEIDYLQWLFGDLKLNYAKLRRSASLQLEVEDLADLVLETEHGTVCSIHLDFLQKRPKRKCVIIGEFARLEWDLIENCVTTYTKSVVTELYSDPMWDRNEMYLSMLADFISGKKHKLATLESSLKIIELIGKAKVHSEGEGE